MKYQLAVTDFNFDWALKDGYLTAKEVVGYMTREEILQNFKELNVDQVELTHPYWADCSTSYVKELCDEAGLTIFSYMFFVDLAVPSSERQKALEEICVAVDRIREFGATRGFLLPARAKEGVSLEDQRQWLIEGLRKAAEYAQQAGVALYSENCEWPPIRPLMGRGGDCAESVQGCRFAGLQTHLGRLLLHFCGGG